ncbi:MAG: hypothetical protein QM784_11715 [Polyangiaceae bacterium]
MQLRKRFVLPSFVLFVVACSGADDSSDGSTSGQGGSANGTTPGTNAIGGGDATAVGGRSGAGTVSAKGGATTASGGKSSVGGATVSGGSSTAGAGALGGAATNTGGSASGGASNTGGATKATGGAGGKTSGGTTAKGGSSAVGGTTAKGGSSAVGGTTAKGGSSAIGGTTAKGGSSAVGGSGSGGATACDWSTPPSNVSAWVDESWNAQLSGNIKGRKAWLIDNAVMGKGQINLCVRWGASAAPSAAIKTGMAGAVEKWFNDWFSQLDGYGCFPYPKITVKVTGWAVKPGNTGWVSESGERGQDLHGDGRLRRAEVSRQLFLLHELEPYLPELSRWRGVPSRLLDVDR